MADDGSSSVDQDIDTQDTQTPPEFAAITSQEEFDRRIKDRIARVKAAPPADYEDLKAKAARLDEIEEANKTELERERDRATKAEEEAARVKAEAQQIRLDAALLAELAKPERKVVSAQAALKLLDRSILTLDESGSPTNVTEAITQLLEANAFLVAPNGGSRGSADQGARTSGAGQVSEEQLKTMNAEDINKARREGRLNEVLGVTS